MSEHPDCQRALDQLQDWLRREVSPEAAAELEAHLDRCSPCRAHAEFEERFRAVLERASDGVECPPETRERLLDALRREQQGG
jgi:anti-sigma factor (TIGR02949 family)